MPFWTPAFYTAPRQAGIKEILAGTSARIAVVQCTAYVNGTFYERNTFRQGHLRRIAAGFSYHLLSLPDAIVFQVLKLPGDNVSRA